MKARNRTLLAIILASAVALSWAAVLAGCNKGTGGPTTITTGPAGGKPTTLQVAVGEQATAGDIRIIVPVAMLTVVPSQPMYPLASVPAVRPGAGQTFFQAMVRIENGGSKAVRVDPHDFSAMVGRIAAPLDESRSGPEARTLLHGASLELSLTFVVPEGAEPDLVYHPHWLNGTLVFRGQQRPIGVL